MNFLSNLYNTVKTGAKNILSNISASWQTSTVGQNMAGVINSINRKSTTPVKRPLEIYEVGQDNLAYGTNNPNIIAYNPTKTGGVNSPGTTFYNAQTPGSAGAENFNNSSYNLRPSTSMSGNTSTGGSQGGTRQSTPQQGTAYKDASGKLVIPTQGFTGEMGQGGGGTVNSPVPGATGVSGAGAPGYRSTGQGTTSTAYNSLESDEEARKRANETIISRQVSAPTAGALSALNAQGQQAPIEAPGVPDTIDAGFLTKIRDTLNSTINSGLSEVDKQTVYSQLSQNLLTAKAKLDQRVVVPDNPVLDTQEQLDFLSQTADPFGVKQAMDDFRNSNTNLGALQVSRVEIMKNVQALNEAYRPIIDEIKENPNLPKALARRKLEGLAVTQKETLQGFLDQLSILNQQIDDQNEVVNRQFQIVNFSQNQANRAQDDLRANLSLMMNSGAIAGFDDADINRYAAALGVNPKTLMKARDKALEPELNIVTNEFADGSLRGIDQKTGKEVWRIAGAGQPAAQTVQGESSGIQAQLLKSRNEGDEADGVYADPNLYAKLRSAAKMSASEFDNRFGYLVNPASKGRLGVGASASTGVTPQGQLSGEQLNVLNMAKATIDTAKQRYQYSPQLRDQIIQRAQSTYGFDLSPYI